MANCSILKDGNKILFAEAPNGQRSDLFDNLTQRVGSKEEAVAFWLVSKTPTFINNVIKPKIGEYRKELLKKVNNLTLRPQELMLEIDGGQVKVDLASVKYTNVRRVGVNSIAAYIAPINQATTAIQSPTEVIITPQNQQELFKVNKYLFDLNDTQAQSAAVLSDAIIGNMANRANISKYEMYKKIGFGKTTAEKLKGTGALFQGDYLDQINDSWNSSTVNAINSIKTEKANPQQWIQGLIKEGGKGTSQELEWLGLKDFLDNWIVENKQKSIPKQVVQDFIDNNQIEIEEVINSNEDHEIVVASTSEDYEWVIKDTDIVLKRVDEGFDIFDKEIKIGGRRGMGDAMDLAKQIARDTYGLKEAKYPGTPKYSDYQLPNGENYREILLILPNKASNLEGKRNKLSQELFKMDYKYISSEQKRLVIREVGGIDNSTWFTSEHWEEKNVLAHVRLNTRVAEDGTRILFVEELQSDIAQDILRDQKDIVTQVNIDFEEVLQKLISKGIVKEDC